MNTLRFSLTLFLGCIPMLQTGCSAYWPLSDDLEQAIREEASMLSPAISEDDAVIALAERVTEHGLASPRLFRSPRSRHSRTTSRSLSSAIPGSR